MYQRFLNNEDYLSIITEEALEQLTRGRELRLFQAEEAAEASIVEYLVDNYEIEKTLWTGKSLMPYNSQITYPVHAHFYHEGKIYEAIRAINGLHAPSAIKYWKEIENYDARKIEAAQQYSQLLNYQPGDVVTFANGYFECLEPNGLDFHDIRIPGVEGWTEVEVYNWEPNLPYNLWDVVSYDGKFYALINLGVPEGEEEIDLTVNPFDSSNWGLIGTYDPDYAYEFKETEFVEFEGKLYIPSLRPTADELKEGYNVRLHDPRNSNIKKHMVQLALYELHKLISPNNMSSVRITDYETSITWLRDANRMKINPQIPRKIDSDNKPVAEYAIATFMRDYDPNQNPWQI